MKILPALILATPLLVSTYSHAATSTDTIRLVAQTKENGIPYKKASPLSALAAIANQNEQRLSETISAHYQALQTEQSIPATRSFALYAIMLQNMLPTLCQNDFEKQPNKTIDDYFLTTAKISDHSMPELMQADLQSLTKEGRVSVQNETFAILLMTKIVCDAYLKSAENSPEMVIHRAGFQLGSTAVVPAGTGTTSELDQMFADAFHTTPEKMQQEKLQGLEELKQKGFLSVADGSIPDIESTYQEYKDVLKNMPDVQKQLSFIPTKLEDNSRFTFLGAEAVGTETRDGYSSVTRLYQSPAGIMTIDERDNATAQSFTMVDPEYLTTPIAGTKGALIAKQGEHSGKFVTEIFWSNPATNRNYSVELNANLNDPKQQAMRDEVIGFLSSQFAK